jgi:hypothetical protein
MHILEKGTLEARNYKINLMKTHPLKAFSRVGPGSQLPTKVT